MSQKKMLINLGCEVTKTDSPFEATEIVRIHLIISTL